MTLATICGGDTDDPDITWIDHTHPVVYAGVGSHSGAYLPGEYLVCVQPPALQRFFAVGDQSASDRRGTLRRRLRPSSYRSARLTGRLSSEWYGLLSVSVNPLWLPWVTPVPPVMGPSVAVSRLNPH